MLESWNDFPDRRIQTHMLYSKLIEARTSANNSYELINHNDDDDKNSLGSDRSSLSKTPVATSPQYDIIYDLDNDETYNTEDVEPIYANYASRVSLYHTPTPSRNGINSCDAIIETNDGGRLILQGKIDKGHYAVVFKGQYECNNQIIEVAIKRLILPQNQNERNGPEQTRKQLIDFEHEKNIMLSLNHSSIVKIITWLYQPDLMIVMEYVKYGSFIIYLKSHRADLTNKELLEFSSDIANGMQYLKFKKIIHRDLAARNILVDTDKRLKISDFGLSQKADPNGYYMLKSIRDLPMNW